VSAKDRATGKSQAITISASSGLAKQEVERLVRDAEAHAQDDKARRELVDLRNQLDNLAYSLDKLLSENREKLAGQQAEIESAVAETRQGAETDDVATLKGRLERLKQLSQRAAETLYKQAAGGAPGGPAQGASAGQPQEDVVDAEYTVKN